MAKVLGTHRIDKPLSDRIRAMAEADDRTYNYMVGAALLAGCDVLDKGKPYVKKKAKKKGSSNAL